VLGKFSISVINQKKKNITEKEKSQDRRGKESKSVTKYLRDDCSCVE
jgi:hypothetical protein